MHMALREFADWEAAVQQLSTATVHKDTKAAEQLLLRFRSSEAAWAACLQALKTPNTPAEVLLFASQTLKCKVNECGAGVQSVHLQQLLVELLSQLSENQLPSQLVRQLCLTIAGLAALLPGWDGLMDAVQAKLPVQHAVELLQTVAEEGSSDWHHVILPGLTAGQHLQWATSTRDRFRCWSGTVVPLVHLWLGQYGNNTWLLVQLMTCLTAWVRLGCLYQVPAEVAENTTQAALLCLQSSNEQEVMVGLELMLELPESAPEALLTALQPCMLDMAQAVCRTVTAASSVTSTRGSLLHVSAWLKAFAAYCTALPYELMQPVPTQQGVSLRDALLQLSILPQLCDTQLICLPALEVWGTLMECEQAAMVGATQAESSQRELLAEGSEGGQPGDAAREVVAGWRRRCRLLLLHTAANYLAWCQAGEGSRALQQEGVAEVIQDVLQMTCRVLGVQEYLTAVSYVWKQHHRRAEQQQQQQQQQRLEESPSVLHRKQHSSVGCQGGYSSEQQHCLPSLHCPGGGGSRAGWMIDAADYDALPGWQQQQVQAALQILAAAPQTVRLHAAVLMAAAASSAAAAARQVADAGSSPGGPGGARSAGDESQPLPAGGAMIAWDVECGAAITDLLSCAAEALQQPTWSSNGLSQQQQQEFLINFCTAVKVWSTLLVRHVTSAAPGPPGDVAAMSGLLALLLSIMARVEGVTAVAAAAAARAVLTAAVQAGWSHLHQLAQLLLQAVQAPGCGGAAELDLLASLSLCLAAPGGLAAADQPRNLRLLAAQEVLQPSVDFMQQVLEQLRAGTAWSQLPADAEVTICHQLARVKAVLDGRLLLQQHLSLQPPGGNDHPGAWSRHTWRFNRGKAADVDVDADALAEQLAAVAAMDEDQTAGGRMQTTTGIATRGGGEEVDDSVSRGLHEPGDGLVHQPHASQAEAVAFHPDPVLKVLLDQLWPKVHVMVLQYNAKGRFLTQYGKCCSRLLRIQPSLLLSQLQQFLQVAVVGMCRSATCSLAEAFGQVVVLCSRSGSELLLENSALIIQAFNELWEQPEAATLAESAAGDKQPDLAEQVFKLTTKFVKHGRMFGPSSPALAAIEQAVSAAAGCAACCHGKAASSALSLLNAVLDAANGSDSPQRQMLLEMVNRRGTQFAQAAFGALLAPSPLPRLHKASVVLLELAAAVCQTSNSSDHSSRDGARVGPSPAADKWNHSCLQTIFLQAAHVFVPKWVVEQEASRVAVDCAALLSSGSGPQSRSYLVSRRLKKRLRDFAEMHMRSNPVECTSSAML